MKSLFFGGWIGYDPAQVTVNTMIEIEAKILNINPTAVIDQIKALGGVAVGEGWVESFFFDTATHGLRRAGWLLRVRRQSGKQWLTLKKQRQPSAMKRREELEVGVSDSKILLEIFQALGYRIQHRERKYRQSFQLGVVRFEIDKLKDLPPFLEIEAPTEADVRSYARQLGFQETDLVKYSSQDLSKRRGKK